MTQRAQSIFCRAFTRSLFVSVSLCALSFFPIPQFYFLAGTESAERECPTERDAEGCEEKVLVLGSIRRSDRRCVWISRRIPHAGGNSQTSMSPALRLSPLHGHRLANGLNAPLMT